MLVDVLQAQWTPCVMRRQRPLLMQRRRLRVDISVVAPFAAEVLLVTWVGFLCDAPSACEADAAPQAVDRTSRVLSGVVEDDCRLQACDGQSRQPCIALAVGGPAWPSFPFGPWPQRPLSPRKRVGLGQAT